MKDVSPAWQREKYSTVVSLDPLYYECINGFTLYGFQVDKDDLIKIIKINDNTILIFFEGEWYWNYPLYPKKHPLEEQRSIWGDLRELSGE